jgi:aspartate carbamoyltransferase catalytic subunit
VVKKEILENLNISKDEINEIYKKQIKIFEEKEKERQKEIEENKFFNVCNMFYELLGRR